MNVRFRLGLVSFCNALTDPNAISLPLACLLIGRADESGDWVAAAVGWTPPASDPITADLLSDVPRLVRSHVEEIFGQSGDLPSTEAIMRSLHDALRNSVHVSWVGEEQSAEIADLTVDTVRLAKVKLVEAMGETLVALTRRAEQLHQWAEGAVRPAEAPADFLGEVERRSSSMQWFPRNVAAASGRDLHC